MLSRNVHSATHLPTEKVLWIWSSRHLVRTGASQQQNNLGVIEEIGAPQLVNETKRNSGWAMLKKDIVVEKDVLKFLLHYSLGV